jgi:hypothetical protein
MLKTQVNTEVVGEIMADLTDIQNSYPGSSARLTLHTSGDGALIFDRSLMGLNNPATNRVAVDFDKGHERAALNTLRAEIAEKFGA